MNKDRYKPGAILPSEITTETAFFNRRRLLAGGGAAVASALIAASVRAPAFGAPQPARLKAPRNNAMSVAAPLNSYEHITTYNNFYEFGTDKADPAENAQAFRTRPWSVAIEGEAEVRGRFTLEDLLKPHALEERVYRFRCVERWSMVVPWVGFPLADLVKRFKPTSKAKFVEFTTLLDPKQMPGQRLPYLDWPYVEGLRMDEAMHPLTLMVVGVYGRVLPNQNGAPLRLIVPWKYGFKSGKSIVKIRFTERQPRTAWNIAAPDEYGFYANVNPAVDHPRWSQSMERKLGGTFRDPMVETRLFNGYAAEVASLYRGLDLRRNF